MAHSQESTTSSGYWSSQTSTTAAGAPLNSHYLCYWLTSCNGQHEINQCQYWKDDLRGELGIYFSPSNTDQIFTRDRINKTGLKSNPTGCTTVHLLVFNDEKKEVLFGLKLCKDKCSQLRSLQLVFPSAKPYQRNGDMLLVARRAFQWLTTDTDLADQYVAEGLTKHFLFQNANVIYPVHLTNEQASKLTQNFAGNEEFQSLHWFPLSAVLSRLPPRSNYINKTQTDIELKQIHRIEPTGIKLGEHQLWFVVATCLLSIRKHVPGGFQTFLNI